MSSSARTDVHVFDYQSVGEYLRAVFQAKKALKKTFSVRTWARLLGMNSSSLLAMVLTNKRAPSPELAKRLVTYLDLNNSEAAYFQSLIDLAKAAPGSDLRKGLNEKLSRIRVQKTTQRLNRETFEAISDWYFYAIREMVQLPQFREEPHLISQQLFDRISPAEVARAIEILVRLGLLQRNKEKLQYALGSIQIDSHQSEKGLAAYHSQVLELSKKSITQDDESFRHMSGTALCMDSSEVERARAMIHEFHERFIQAFENLKGDTVFQMESTLFPLAHVSK